MDHYLGSLKNSKVKSLQELVQWNKDHAEEALTDGHSVFVLAFDLTNFFRGRIPKSKSIGTVS